MPDQVGHDRGTWILRCAQNDTEERRPVPLKKIPASAGMTGNFKRGNDTISQQIRAFARRTKVGRMTGEKTKYYFRKLTKKIPSGKDQRGVIKHLSMLFFRRQFFLSPHIRLQDLGNQNAAIGLQIVFQ